MYIEETLERYGMENCNLIGTPADLNVNLNDGSIEDIGDSEEYGVFRARYPKAVGSLLYISQTTRPDIAQAVNAVSRFVKQPAKIHWTA